MFMEDEDRVTLKAIIVDARIAQQIKEYANSMGLKVISSTKHRCLYESIAFHPDTVICQVGRGKLVIEPTVFSYYKDALASYKVELIRGTTELSSNYPLNIAYNIATVGKWAFMHSKYADRIVLEQLKQENIRPINVKQGYAKCSTAVVGDNSIITSDTGIYTGALKNGIDALLISPGHIRLKGFDYGFIGGCCGKLPGAILAFAGEPLLHPDGEAILKHAEKHGTKVVSLCRGPLLDVGSIIPVVGKK